MMKLECEKKDPLFLKTGLFFYNYTYKVIIYYLVEICFLKNGKVIQIKSNLQV